MAVLLISKVDNTQRPCLSRKYGFFHSTKVWLVLEFYAHGQTWYKKIFGLLRPWLYHETVKCRRVTWPLPYYPLLSCTLISSSKRLVMKHIQHTLLHVFHPLTLTSVSPSPTEPRKHTKHPLDYHHFSIPHFDFLLDRDANKLDPALGHVHLHLHLHLHRTF